MRLHWIARVFASAIARRLAYVLVAAVLAWCGMGRAHAAGFPDKGSAYAACAAASAGHSAWSNGRQVTTDCEKFGDWPQYTCYGMTSNGAQIVGCSGKDPFYIWPIDAECKKRPDYNGAFPGSLSGTPVSGSYQCNTGCLQTWTPNSDGTWNGTYLADTVCKPDNNDCGGGFHYNANLAMCEPDAPPECPKGQIKKANGQCTDNQCPEGMTLQQDGTCGPSNNECPSGQIKSPAGGCLPGDGQCAAGEVRGPDGTCKKDGDGDGDPDEPGDGDKSQFSGGDNCENPPSCSGDAIMCGQARIQWRIDCNTRRNRNVSGGTCNASPVCTGEKCDAVEYSSMMFQWRSACAAEKLLAKGDGTGTGQPEWTKVNGDGTGGAGADPEKPHRTVALGVGMLDSGGFLGGGGSCPKFGSVSLGKYGSVDLDQWDWICRFFAAVRMVFIALGSFIAFTILGGRSIF